MKILLFYDNFVRDFRGLYFLKKVLERMGNVCFLEPLFKDAIYFIKKYKPDIVVLGQMGEFSTSKIGLFCAENSINLCLNTTEFIARYDNIDVFFRINYRNYNDDIIDMQVLGGDLHKKFVLNNSGIKNKDKYKLTGIPRMDFNIIPELRDAEVSELRQKYKISSNMPVYLYVSSFIYDDSGGQFDEENKNDVNYDKLYNDEQILKKISVNILNKFSKYLEEKNGILLIKKHPWDKSSYLKQHLTSNSIIFVDNYEHISPLIQISDAILHYQSTAAIEAWMQKKKTIAVIPHFDGNYENFNYHMKYDTIIKTYDELISFVLNREYEKNVDDFLQSFNYNMDGRATFRVAKEISMMTPKGAENKKISLGMNERIRKHIHRIVEHLNKPELPKETYSHLLNSYEIHRSDVEKKYSKLIDDYISRNLVQ